MSYYDHATAMVYKLGRWREERVRRNYEIEEQESELRSLPKVEQRPCFPRLLASIRSGCVFKKKQLNTVDEDEGD